MLHHRADLALFWLGAVVCGCAVASSPHSPDPPLEALQEIRTGIQENEIIAIHMLLLPYRVGTPTGTTGPELLNMRAHFRCTQELEPVISSQLISAIDRTSMKVSDAIDANAYIGIGFEYRSGELSPTLYLSRPNVERHVSAFYGAAVGVIGDEISVLMRSLFPRQIDLANPFVSIDDERCENTGRNPYQR